MKANVTIGGKAFGWADVDILVDGKPVDNVKPVIFTPADIRAHGSMTITDHLEVEQIKSMMDHLMEVQANNIQTQKDELIANTLRDKGYDPTDFAWLKDHLFRVTLEDDPNFEHWFIDFENEATRTRIISISKPIYSEPGAIEHTVSLNYF